MQQQLQFTNNINTNDFNSDQYRVCYYSYDPIQAVNPSNTTDSNMDSTTTTMEYSLYPDHVQEQQHESTMTTPATSMMTLSPRDLDTPLTTGQLAFTPIYSPLLDGFGYVSSSQITNMLSKVDPYECPDVLNMDPIVQFDGNPSKLVINNKNNNVILQPTTTTTVSVSQYNTKEEIDPKDGNLLATPAPTPTPPPSSSSFSPITESTTSCFDYSSFASPPFLCHPQQEPMTTNDLQHEFPAHQHKKYDNEEQLFPPLPASPVLQQQESCVRTTFNISNNVTFSTIDNNTNTRKRPRSQPIFERQQEENMDDNVANEEEEEDEGVADEEDDDDDEYIPTAATTTTTTTKRKTMARTQQKSNNDNNNTNKRQCHRLKNNMTTNGGPSITTFAIRKKPPTDDYNSRPHVCPVCYIRFSRSYNLRTHQLTHDKNRPKPFSCNVCEKGFARKHDRDRHVSAVHAGERSYKCSQCDASFARKTYLTSHMSTNHSL